MSAERGEDGVDVFISYARTDLGSVRPFVDALRFDHGLSVWIDHGEIEPFAHIGASISAGIARARAVVVWYTPDYALRPYCMWEFCQVWMSIRRGTASMDQLIPINVRTDTGHLELGLAGSLLFARNSRPVQLSGVVAARIAGIDQRVGDLSDNQISLVDIAELGVVRLPTLCAIDEQLWSRTVSAGTQRPGFATIVGVPGSGRRTVARQYASLFGSLYPTGVETIDGTGLSYDDLRPLLPTGTAGNAGLLTITNIDPRVAPQLGEAWLGGAVTGSLIVTTTAGAGISVPALCPYEGVSLMRLHWPEAADHPEFADRLVEQLGAQPGSIVAAACEIRLSGFDGYKPSSSISDRQRLLVEDLSDRCRSVLAEVVSLSLTRCPVDVLRAGLLDDRDLRRVLRELEYTQVARVSAGCVIIEAWAAAAVTTNDEDGVLDTDGMVEFLRASVEATEDLLRAARAIGNPTGRAPLRHRVAVAQTLGLRAHNHGQHHECLRYITFAFENATAATPKRTSGVVLAAALFQGGEFAEARTVLDAIASEQDDEFSVTERLLRRQITAEIGER